MSDPQPKTPAQTEFLLTSAIGHADQPGVLPSGIVQPVQHLLRNVMYYRSELAGSWIDAAGELAEEILSIDPSGLAPVQPRPTVDEMEAHFIDANERMGEALVAIGMALGLPAPRVGATWGAREILAKIAAGPAADRVETAARVLHERRHRAGYAHCCDACRGDARAVAAALTAGEAT